MRGWDVIPGWHGIVASYALCVITGNRRLSLEYSLPRHATRWSLEGPQNDVIRCERRSCYKIDTIFHEICWFLDLEECTRKIDNGSCDDLHYRRYSRCLDYNYHWLVVLSKWFLCEYVELCKDWYVYDQKGDHIIFSKRHFPGKALSRMTFH